MATFLDIGLLQKFSIIFPFLFAIVIVYGILSYTKIFGDNKGLHALMAFIVGVFLLFSPTVREIINLMAPWFVLFFVFILFVLIAFKMLGATDSDIMGVLQSKKYSYVVWWVIAIALIIGIGSLSSVTFKEGVPQGVNETSSERTSSATSSGTGAFWNTLFHPKVLGLAVILLIAMFTVSRVTEPE